MANNTEDVDQTLEESIRSSVRQAILKDPNDFISITGDMGIYDIESRVVADLLDLIRTEKLKLLAELDKSMPTAEQLTTKYGYHMPEKQYGYKLALYDIREALTKLEAEL